MTEEGIVLEFEQPLAEIESQIRQLESAPAPDEARARELKELQDRHKALRRQVYGGLTPWQRVQVARHPRRPYTKDYIGLIFQEFTELCGDRAFADDRAMLAGLAFLDEIPVAIVGHQKGRTLEEAMAQNFGMPHPEGYRKALRVMELAGRFGLPIVSFIDTPGAYPGIQAEERGQAEAIAKNLCRMSSLEAPIVVCVIGEGGSGGALGIGVGNRILMMENAWYSVISPEGCAAILFHDAARAPEAAEALKLTAKDLKTQGVIDEIVPEPAGGAHRYPEESAANLKAAIKKHLTDLLKLSPQELVEDRYEKFRRMGVWKEKKAK
jgi:acetyl-CoA carboxylase carboxyl transferase subunit alpha